VAGAISSDGTRTQDFNFLKAKRVLAFSGIAANENFFQSLRDTGCLLVEAMPYRDHHRYSRADISRIRQTAKKRQVDFIITTEKDYYRLPQATNLENTLVVAGVEIKFPNEDFDDFLTGKVAFHQKKKRSMRTSLDDS
jgi:tetraacyldisaccharide 4'-kinase